MSTQGRKTGHPTCLVEAPVLLDYQHVTTSPPGPDKEEGEVTPSDANRAMAKNGSSWCFLAKNGCTLKTIATESVVGRI